MKAQPLKVKVPYWAKDIKHEGILLLIAFMYRINTQYGPDRYTMQTSDVNTIIGMKTMNLDKFIYKICPEAKNWLYIDWTNAGFYFIELKHQARCKEQMQVTEWVWIEDERLVRVWCYLLGAFRHHLITEDPFSSKNRSGMFTSDSTLFKYSQYESGSK